MNAALAIAALTIKEAVRRRLLAAFVAITVVIVGLSAWGFDRLSHTRNLTSGETNLAVPEALILFMFMFSFILALSASAIASPSISSEVESGILMTIVTRPVRRTEVLLGKWLGLATLLAGYAVGVCVLEFGVIRLVQRLYPAEPGPRWRLPVRRGRAPADADDRPEYPGAHDRRGRHRCRRLRRGMAGRGRGGAGYKLQHRDVAKHR